MKGMLENHPLFLSIFLAVSLGFALAFIAVMSLQPSWYPLLSAGSMDEMLGTLTALR